MKTFLKKYWVQLLFLVAASLLFFILIPNQENSYLNSDVKAIKEKTSFVLIAILVILLAIIFISALKHLKTFKEFLNFFPGIIVLGLVLFFILTPIFLFAGLALNKKSAKESVERKYRVVSSEKNGLIIQNIQSGKSDFVEQIVQENERYEINPNDTLTLRFKKGLFGFEFDPTHRGNFVYPDKIMKL